MHEKVHKKTIVQFGHVVHEQLPLLKQNDKFRLWVTRTFELLKIDKGY